MADGTDVLLELWKEQREADRQTENQRATLTNIIIIVVAAGLGFIALSGLRPTMLVVTLPMMALGLYGAFACLKFHERCAFHVGQARGLRKKIAEQFPDLKIEATLRATSREQRGRFPQLRRIRLYVVWTTLHGAIAAAGAGLSMWIIIS
ncbi:hypothetical protein StrepF001_44475 [Streptomyces sp. F001]|uniref:hypothetical protein n=1 Tax=Streptomyces sp. F001 TaxID=1510026 RepID=UPI00101E649A|nr:hypothetical protein [Streptomyces sp. F001]RZB13382.1 hypothetical protein StrepF001_44475 [Streptomyces sp. F001]